MNPPNAPAGASDQKTLLTTALLRFNPAVRRGTRYPQRVVLHAAGRARLVVTPGQTAILTDLFAEPRTVPEVLVRLLAQRDAESSVQPTCPPLGEYYELVLQAHAAGVLVAGDAPEETPAAPQRPLRLPVGVALVLGVLAIGAGAFGLGHLPWSVSLAWSDLVVGWLVACGLLSLGEALAAGALAGGGGEVRTHFHGRTLLPHFRVESGEAVMGGPACEAAVAILRVAPLVAGAAAVMWRVPSWTVPVLAGLFYGLAPWRGSAAWQALRAGRGTPGLSVGAGFSFDAPRDAADASWWSAVQEELGSAGIGWALAWFALAVWAGGWCLAGFAMLEGLLLAPYGIAAAILLLGLWLGSRPKKSTAAGPAVARPAPGAKLRVLSTDIETALSQIPLFQTLADQDLKAVAGAMVPESFVPGREIFREGDPGDAFYVVQGGELEVLKRRPAPAQGTHTVTRLGPGDSFGEIALLEGTDRSSTVRAVSFGRLLRMPRTQFWQLAVSTVGATRIRELLQNAAFLRRLVLVGDWPFEDLLRFARRCESVRYQAGDRVVRKDEPNAWFFLIYDGTFELRTGAGVLRRLEAGDYFGEISLLNDSLAIADVIAIEESRCLAMGRDDFLEFFARDFRVGLRMGALAVKRASAKA